jgi:dephospho-CoA kinase
MKLVVGLTGLSASGKSTIASDLAKRHGFTRVSFGDVVRREALARKQSDISLQDLGLTLISEWGWTRFCTQVLGESIRKDRVVIDGIRHRSALTTLQELVAPARLFLVFVDIAHDQRTLRLNARKHARKRDAPLAIHPIESEVEQLRLAADLVVQGMSERTSDRVLKHVLDNVTKLARAAQT